MKISSAVPSTHISTLDRIQFIVCCNILKTSIRV